MKKKFNKYNSIIIAIIVQLLFTMVIFTYINNNKILKVKEARVAVLHSLTNVKSRIEKSLNLRIYYTKSVATNISINPSITNDEFYELSEQLIQSDSVVGTLSLARKDFIISAIFPLKGNEKVIGLNHLKHPKRRKIVNLTIQTRNTFIAGPVELLQGGEGFISYTPIFNKIDGKNSIWGITGIVILKDKLFNEANFKTNDNKYNYAIKGTDGTGINGACFFGNEKVFEQDPIKVEILLPTGNWVLACTPKIGWENYYSSNDNMSLILYSGSIITSLLIFLFLNANYRIRRNEKKLAAFFGSMQDIIMEIDHNGHCISLAPTSQPYLVKHSKLIIDKSIFETLEIEDNSLILNGIDECLKSKKMVSLEFPMLIQNSQFWFQARISYISDNLLIFVAHDNTIKIESEKILKQSELKLIELNNSKDKFFSIIAHDLRGPLGNIKTLLNLINESDSDFDEVERAEFLKLLEQNANNIYELLNNLLQWSSSQSGIIVYNPLKVLVKSIVSETISVLEVSFNNKRIELINNVIETDVIIADQILISTVIRNLLSNAIKFTPEGGKIIISTKSKDKFVEISVEDNGIGMSYEQKDKLFKIGSKMTTSGTNKETGTGLGLILCKEFVEKHNGIIWVESEKGKGSKFTFTIPK